MKPFKNLCEIEQFAEDPQNRVVGEFRCLLSDVRVYGCHSVDAVTWRMAHCPESGRHPYAIAKHIPKEAA